jgi:peptidoglycan/xylan/chitin deacetylase (PgdA/CDA1 family)
MLSILDTYGIKASFLLSGLATKQFHEIVKNIFNQGHEIVARVWDQNTFLYIC